MGGPQAVKHGKCRQQAGEAVGHDCCWRWFSVLCRRSKFSQLRAEGNADRLQRQLLCIARVLLQKRKIVVLDEASSSMDTGTDKQLLEVLNTALRDVTVISVAHRISTIVAYDNVMVLDSGRILETGVPRELLTQEDSHFAGLYKAQTA